MNKTEGQVTFADLGIWCGKMYPEPSAPQEAKISGLSSKRPAELLTAPYLYLDLRAGYGSLLGPLWESDSVCLGEYWTLNTGLSPKGAKESSLSQILEATPLPKYYLSRTACLGILRRARKRGKELPPILKRALEIQAGAQPAAKEETANV
jgi:hypothetical protein